ncbi:Vacuolar protein sorting-associated protein 13C [Operophtera brumata]|uniref:Vacuolar protein sorting-associated protein 13C n=1 Tax=Operophtera brumata TaxID=104452 RepID=A0A0L7KY50_OPEBR|nr:Vacuolar protein sorting-associated protein 13C [Operophtera brumata]
MAHQPKRSDTIRFHWNKILLDELSPDILHFGTDISHQQFINIMDETPSLQEYSNGKTMLGIYLCKLRSGEPNRRLASIFGMPRQTLQLKIQQTIHCLEDDFLPRHLRFDHITRDETMARNRIHQ